MNELEALQFLDHLEQSQQQGDSAAVSRNLVKLIELLLGPENNPAWIEIHQRAHRIKNDYVGGGNAKGRQASDLATPTHPS